jgi:hypothetical protein
MKLIRTTVTAIVLGATTIVTANAATTPNFIGQLVQVDSADRTIALDSGTRYVNVTQGEKVTFVAKGREFTIFFDGAAQNTDLRNLAPEGALDHEVLTYVGVNPFYVNN